MKSLNKSILLFALIIAAAVFFMIIKQPLISILILGVYIICKFYIRKYVRLSRKANRAYLSKDYKTALTLIEEASFIPNCNAKTISSFVFLTLKQGSPDNLLEKIDAILANNTTLKQKDRNFVELHKALVYWNINDLDSALKIAENIYKIDKEPFTYELYGFFLIQKGDLENAFNINLEGTKIPNSTKVITTNLGETYFRQGEIDKAADIFTSQIKEKVKFVEPHYYMGVIQHMRGEDETALRTLESALYCPKSLLTSISAEDIKNRIFEIDPNFKIED